MSWKPLDGKFGNVEPFVRTVQYVSSFTKIVNRLEFYDDVNAHRFSWNFVFVSRNGTFLISLLALLSSWRKNCRWSCYEESWDISEKVAYNMSDIYVYIVRTFRMISWKDATMVRIKKCTVYSTFAIIFIFPAYSLQSTRVRSRKLLWAPQSIRKKIRFPIPIVQEYFPTYQQCQSNFHRKNTTFAYVFKHLTVRNAILQTQNCIPHSGIIFTACFSVAAARPVSNAGLSPTVSTQSSHVVVFCFFNSFPIFRFLAWWSMINCCIGDTDQLCKIQPVLDSIRSDCVCANRSCHFAGIDWAYYILKGWRSERVVRGRMLRWRWWVLGSYCRW